MYQQFFFSFDLTVEGRRFKPLIFNQKVWIFYIKKRRPWYLIVEAYWWHGQIWCGCCSWCSMHFCGQIELMAQLMSQLSIKLFVLPVVHDKLWKWLLQVVCIFSIFIASPYLFVLPVVHDKRWKWLLQVVCIFSLFIALSHKRLWKIRLVT